MSFKVGDKVLFKKEKEKGEIVMLIGNLKALVRNSYGFKVQVMLSDLILYSSQNDSSLSYGESFPDKDIENEGNRYKKYSKKYIDNKVDLHIENLIEDFEGLSHQEIIDVQINYFQKVLNKYFNRNRDSVVVIHGIGNGVLKENIHALLEDHNLRFFLSLDGGSTTVLF